MSKNEEPKVSIGASELKDILLSVIEEARKPVVTEREKRELEQQQEERKNNAAEVKRERENRQAFRETCNHLRRDGTSRAVFVNLGDHGSFMICQLCQACIHPGERPASNPHPEHFYDTALFNRLFQLSGVGDIMS